MANTIIPGLANIVQHKHSIQLTDVLPSIDVEQMAEHLSLLHEGARGSTCLAWVDAGVINSRWTHIWVNNNVNVRQHILDESNFWKSWIADTQCKLQLYTAVGSFRANKEKFTRTQSLSAQLPGVWADIDVKPNAENHFHTREQLNTFLDKLPTPTLLVNTGSGGCHPYWLFTRRTTTNERVRNILEGWHTYLQEIAGKVLIDNVQEPSRVLRVAGSVRWAKNDELVHGATPFTRVELAHVTGQRYTLDELEELVTPALQRQRDRQSIELARYHELRTMSLKTLERRGLSTTTQAFIEQRFNETQDWGHLLKSAGWTLTADHRGTGGSSACRYWVRPGLPAGSHASGTTDYAESTIMTFLSNEVHQLDKLIHHGIRQAQAGCTTKYRFALIALYNGDESRLIRDIYRGNGVLL